MQEVLNKIKEALNINRYSFANKEEPKPDEKPDPNLKITVTYGDFHRNLKLYYCKGDIEVGFHISDFPSNCGATIMHNIRISDEAIDFCDEIFKLLVKIYKQDGVGSILCVYGSDYKREIDTLELLGFKVLSEYNNWRHGCDYLQTLLQYKIE